MDKQGGVAEIVYDICRALVESPSTPAYSEVHESLAPVVSSADSRELLDWMVNNSRARVTLDESDESLESLNLAGYSIDSVDKRLGAALARAVFRHGLEKLDLHELYMDGQVAAATGEKAHRSTELHAAMRQLNKLYL